MNIVSIRFLLSSFVLVSVCVLLVLPCVFKIDEVQSNSISKTVQNSSVKDTVQIGSGLVMGFVEDGVKSFIGIPYASPPVGALRLNFR